MGSRAGGLGGGRREMDPSLPARLKIPAEEL